jgi:hypothetical protein
MGTDGNMDVQLDVSNGGHLSRLGDHLDPVVECHTEARSGLRYSVPKKTSCGDAWFPTSTAIPPQ